MARDCSKIFAEGRRKKEKKEKKMAARLSRRRIEKFALDEVSWLIRAVI